ncbi:MAG: hypothetical protein WBF53_08840, partial [Litorimonas sp.]
MALYNRRLFLQASAAGFLGAGGALSALASRPAFAASASGYKALVGIFLKGGVDGFDMVLPFDADSLDGLTALRPNVINGHRGATARARETLLGLAPDADRFGGRRFALAPEMKAMHGLIEAGDGCVVGNVGPLLEPTTRSGMEAGRNALPARLFSH